MSIIILGFILCPSLQHGLNSLVVFELQVGDTLTSFVENILYSSCHWLMSHEFCAIVE